MGKNIPNLQELLKQPLPGEKYNPCQAPPPGVSYGRKEKFYDQSSPHKEP